MISEGSNAAPSPGGWVFHRYRDAMREKERAIARGALDIDRKERLRRPPQSIPMQDPQVRIHNFDEVCLGFDPATAILEASRCIQCPDPAPCQRACPGHNQIPEALWLIENEDFLGAIEKWRETSNLNDICGRVCPQERLCEGACVVGKRSRPVAIGRLEAFVADFQRKTLGGWPLPVKDPPSGFQVAVVGSGPAGLSCAEELAKRGHEVIIYEALPYSGGLLLYGIPNFKLPKDIVTAKIEQLKKMGIKFVTNTRIGEAITVPKLLEEGFDAVFIGTGTWASINLGVPGEDLQGIYPATDFLIRGNLPKEVLPHEMQEPLQVGKRAVVIGGGDTAMDCLRTARRLGAEEVICAYRRSEAEMPGSKKEKDPALEEGVKFMYLVAPVRFLSDDQGQVQAIELIWMKLGEPDASGRRRPIPIPGSEFVMEADTVILALGYRLDPAIEKTTPGLKTEKGLIIVAPETGQTNLPGVFAGGDNVHGADLVVTAMAAGRKAAAAIHCYLQEKEEILPRAA